VCLYVLSFALYFVLGRAIVPITSTDTLATPGIPQPVALVIGVVFVVLLFATPAWLLFKVMKRYNWARIALSLVSALGFALFSPYLFQVAASHPTAPVFANATLEIIALVLLFTPRANQWFKSDPQN
jgi:NADH:ubiquinone oxidoreductase subunit 6 (subunit J)